ncbi:MAG: hypothetical protein WDO69_02010 [Pseudomonadota bacterium]
MGRSIAWATTVAVLCLAQPRGALADGDNGPPPSSSTNPSADESFREGHALLKDKRYADACRKFEQSQRQDPASGTLLALAYCQELSGLLATSWANYLAAAQLAEREGHSDRQSAATERVQALAARVSRLTVLVPPELLSLAGFHLLRDGVEFERASFAVAVPMDGGPHVFLATAPGRVPWTSTVTLLSERDQKTLVLPQLDLAPPPSSNQGTGQSGHAAAAPPASVTGDTAEHDSAVMLKRTGLALAIASAVGVGVGTAFAVSAHSKNDQSNANGNCDSTGCNENGVSLRNDALSAARVATWSFVASGALAAGSVTLFVLASSNHSTSQHAARVQGNLSLGAPGVSLVGSF